MTAISFSAMNLAIRKGGRAYPGENAVLATLAVNISVFTLLLLGAMVTGAAKLVTGAAAEYGNSRTAFGQPYRRDHGVLVDIEAGATRMQNFHALLLRQTADAGHRDGKV